MKQLSLRDFPELYKKLVELTSQTPRLSAPQIAQRLNEERVQLAENQTFDITFKKVKEQWKRLGGRDAFVIKMQRRERNRIPYTANAIPGGSV